MVRTYVHVYVHVCMVLEYHGTMVRTYVRTYTYMLADIVVAIPAVDLAIEAVV
jgi:hypothetical protein